MTKGMRGSCRNSVGRWPEAVVWEGTVRACLMGKELQFCNWTLEVMKTVNFMLRVLLTRLSLLISNKTT